VAGGGVGLRACACGWCSSWRVPGEGVPLIVCCAWLRGCAACGGVAGERSWERLPGRASFIGAGQSPRCNEPPLSTTAATMDSLVATHMAGGAPAVVRRGCPVRTGRCAANGSGALQMRVAPRRTQQSRWVLLDHDPSSSVAWGAIRSADCAAPPSPSPAAAAGLARPHPSMPTAATGAGRPPLRAAPQRRLRPPPSTLA